ncbi:SDR family oxidoreductase [Arthrobacter sp. OV608]|uniref:SDR family oxidoreductase n=1 Tax=Arthrobacter sp. OV608 TaxID=1882768 RepID=UPI0008BE84BA|nr:SDR family oxidoreductase [Arthrobacter sp. OV608]SEQ86354.1 Short-chain dehydrogenase [Arthrobacter sp. OV608]
MRVKNPVVVITGASSGIGRATALRFAARGARLVLAARGAESLEDVARACRRRGAKAIAVPTDVTDVGGMEELAARAKQEFGRLDVWVNNAAVGAFGLLTEIPPKDFQRVLDVNISGYVNGARAALPRMRTQGSGVLINVASVVAEIPLPYSAAYSMSKAAVRALSISLRSELAREGVAGVDVCTVLPATIDTPFYQNAANYTGRRPMAMPPVYTAKRVAKAVVRLVEHPRRELVAGGLAGRLLVLQHKLAPGAVEAATARQVDTRQLSRRRSATLTSGNLSQASQAVRKPSVGGGWHGRRRTAQRRIGTAAALAAAVVAVRKRLG